MIRTVFHDRTAAQHPPLPKLDQREWHAIAIALRDAESPSCRTHSEPLSFGARLLRLLTGIEPRRPLADPRLEALRQYVCSLRRTRREPEDAARELLELGYSRAQLDAINMLTI